MAFPEYADLDATGLAALVRSGEVSATEVVEAAVAQIERLNPLVNAVVHEAYDEARLAAGSAAGPFAGVPMLIKDLGLTVAGWPRTSGSRFAAHVRDSADCGLVERYRASGAILIGRSSTSEFGILGTVETAAYGPTRNPWNLDHTAGGSSGGAAAAVAARMVPIAHASDGLGSIRIPAACCGLVGLKPTRDRVANWPDQGDYAIGFVCDHVVTRSVRDSAAMLDCTSAATAAVPGTLPPPQTPFAEEVERSPGRLRIRWSSRRRGGKGIDPVIEAALVHTADVLARLGHDVREQPLDADIHAFEQARMPVSAANFAATMARVIDEAGRKPQPGDFEPLTHAALILSRHIPGEAGLFGLQLLRSLAGQLLEQFETFDVFLSPVMSALPPRLGFLNGPDITPADIDARQNELYPYTPLFNYSGQPSISLPLAWSPCGLPIGLMLTARYGDEATLFRLAGQLEKEMPWAHRKPLIVMEGHNHVG